MVTTVSQRSGKSPGDGKAAGGDGGDGPSSPSSAGTGGSFSHDSKQDPSEGPDPTLLREAHERATVRLVPLFFFATLVGFMDRAALSSTAPALVDALGLSDAEYGIASGVFYISYVIMQYPSVVITDLTGVRIWYGSIILMWGLITILTAFVENVTQLIIARFLLGFAEAGVSIIAYVHLDRFLVAREMTRVWSNYILIAVLLANIIMGPLSALILATMTDVGGLQSYQWVFIIMGILALIMCVAVYVFMVDSIETAPIFTQDQRATLLMAKAQQGRASNASQMEQLMIALRSWKSWYLGSMGMMFSFFHTVLQLFLPLLILDIISYVPTLSTQQDDIYSVFLSAIPYIVGGLALILFAESSLWLSHLRHPKLWVGTAALGVLTLLTATYVLINPSHTVGAFVHLTILVGIVIGFSAPLDTLPTDYMQKEGVGKCYAVFTTLKTIGSALGPILFGFLLEIFPANEGLSIFGTATILPMVLLYVLFFYVIDRTDGKPVVDGPVKKNDGSVP